MRTNAHSEILSLLWTTATVAALAACGSSTDDDAGRTDGGTEGGGQLSTVATASGGDGSTASSAGGAGGTVSIASGGAESVVTASGGDSSVALSSGGTGGGSVAASGGQGDPVATTGGASGGLEGASGGGLGAQPPSSGGTSQASGGGSGGQGSLDGPSGGTSASSGGQVGTTGGGGNGPAGGSAGQGGQEDATGGLAGSGDPPSGTVPVISNLTVDPNPNSTISCFVSWTTDVASTSQVQFGEAGYEFRIVDDGATAQHRVLVIGMHAESDYLIKAISTTSGGEAVAEASFTTGALPEQVPVGTVTVSEAGAWQQGWTLTNIMHGNGSGSFSATSPSAMVMYDEIGLPVWYYVNGASAENRGDVPCDYLESGNVLIGAQSGEPPREIDLAGDIVWEGPAQGTGTESPISHYTGKLSNGHYLVLREYRSPEYNVVGALIEELDSSNQILWSWNMFDHVQPPAGADSDWCHGNSITTLLDQDIFYLSCRWLGVFKVERSTGNVIWHMAATSGEMAGDFNFDPTAAQMSDQHDPEIHDDGTILLFDNGGWDGFGGTTTQRHSRVIEFDVNEQEHTATRIWEFPGTFSVDSWYYEDLYLPYWGDADRLANGNILVAAGVRDASKQTRIFEVRRSDGQVVWELQLPADNGIFRAERISPPPLVERLE